MFVCWWVDETGTVRGTSERNQVTNGEGSEEPPNPEFNMEFVCQWMLHWPLERVTATNTTIYSLILVTHRHYTHGPLQIMFSESPGVSSSLPRMASQSSFKTNQFSHSVVSDYLRPYGLQHPRLPCPSPTLEVYSNSHPLSHWCHPAISSSVIPFSSCLQSFPASGSFQMSQLFASSGQSIGVSALASVLPMNIRDWLPLGWTGWISLQSKGLSRVFSNTTPQKHQLFGAQLSTLESPIFSKQEIHWESCCTLQSRQFTPPEMWPRRIMKDRTSHRKQYERLIQDPSTPKGRSSQRKPVTSVSLLFSPFVVDFSLYHYVSVWVIQEMTCLCDSCL